MVRAKGLKGGEMKIKSQNIADFSWHIERRIALTKQIDKSKKELESLQKELQDMDEKLKKFGMEII